MTVSSTTSRVTYATDGSSTAFPVSFYFLANADLVVLLVDADGNSETLVLTTDYTVSGAGVESGGTVTLLSAPAPGYTIVIYRDPAVTQLTDYAPNDPFPAETHERALDKLTMICQRLYERVARSFGLADSDTSGASVLIPTPVAGRALKWADDGLSLVNSAVDPDAASAFADEAESFAIAAAASAADAATIYDNFDDRYLGAKASDPATDNDGDALLNGALYWNTAMSKLRIYNGSSWQDTATATPASFTSNLFNGTGAQTAFTLSTSPATAASIFVFISGVAQRPTTDYSVSGTTLTFVTAPPAGTNNVLAFVASTVSVGTPDNGSVTYQKIQNASTGQVVIGRNAAGTGQYGEVTLSQLLDWIGSAAEGDILYRGASAWQRLAKGSDGQLLSLASGVPAWASVGKTNVTTASAAYTPASGETLSRPHGQASVPLSARLVLECVTADNGYTPGERVCPGIYWNGSATNGLYVYCDATNCGVKCPTGFVVAINNKTTGLGVTPTATRWKYYFEFVTA